LMGLFYYLLISLTSSKEMHSKTAPL